MNKLFLGSLFSGVFLANLAWFIVSLLLAAVVLMVGWNVGLVAIMPTFVSAITYKVAVALVGLIYIVKAVGRKT